MLSRQTSSNLIWFKSSEAWEVCSNFLKCMENCFSLKNFNWLRLWMQVCRGLFALEVEKNITKVRSQTKEKCQQKLFLWISFTIWLWSVSSRCDDFVKFNWDPMIIISAKGNPIKIEHNSIHKRWWGARSHWECFTESLRNQVGGRSLFFFA